MTPLTDEQRERYGKAAYAANHEKYEQTWDWRTDDKQETYRVVAEAAIQAFVADLAGGMSIELDDGLPGVKFGLLRVGS